MTSNMALLLAVGAAKRRESDVPSADRRRIHRLAEESEPLGLLPVSVRWSGLASIPLWRCPTTRTVSKEQLITAGVVDFISVFFYFYGQQQL